MTIKIKISNSTDEEKEILARIVQMKKENNEFVAQLIESIPAIQKQKEKDYDEVERQIEELIEKRSRLENELEWYEKKLSWLEETLEKPLLEEPLKEPSDSTLFKNLIDIKSMGQQEDYLSDELLEKNSIAKSYESEVFHYEVIEKDEDAYLFKLYKAIRPFYKSLDEETYDYLFDLLNFDEDTVDERDFEYYRNGFGKLPFNFDVLEIELTVPESISFSERSLKRLNDRMHLYLTSKEKEKELDEFDDFYGFYYDDDIAELEARYQNELKEQS